MNASDTDSVLFELEPITVSALRFDDAYRMVPFSIASLDRIDVLKGRRQLTLLESMQSVPGLFGLNSTNFAQDLRIAIRGFGARSSFGIRGIQILLDDIPITTPDGQTQIDNIDLSLIKRVEVLRGPLSTLYGNASGGVINLYTGLHHSNPFAESRMAAGDHGFLQGGFHTGWQSGKLNISLSGLHNRANGYRKHSAMESYLFNGMVQYLYDSSSVLTIRFNYEDSPKAMDPGGLTKEQVSEDRTQAFSRNLEYDAGEEVAQGRLALSYHKKYGQNQGFKVVSYMNRRDFNNRLPFTGGGMVDLQRLYFGASTLFYTNVTVLKKALEFRMGIDMSRQGDRRKRFNNVSGERGDRVFDQKEKYSGAGLFSQVNLELSKSWAVTAGSRIDKIRIEAVDHFKADGISSGKRSLYGTSWTLGSSFKPLNALVLFANASTGFESPTLIELTTNPRGDAGLNADLQPQKALNLETGIKGIIGSILHYDGTVFIIDVKDALVPFELASTPGRTYYRNSGSSRHRGVELGLKALPAKGLSVASAYTYSDFVYIDYLTPSGRFDDKYLPGIPRHHLYAELFYAHPSSLYGRIECQAASRIYVNDSNSESEPSRLLITLQTGFEYHLGKWQMEPSFQIFNVFNQAYSDNIRINAFGNRYYEPAAERAFYASLKIYLPL